jgi:hypothetical protein
VPELEIKSAGHFAACHFAEVRSEVLGPDTVVAQPA